MTSRMLIYIQVYCVINPKYKIKGDGIMLALKHSKQNEKGKKCNEVIPAPNTYTI